MMLAKFQYFPTPNLSSPPFLCKYQFSDLKNPPPFSISIHFYNQMSVSPSLIREALYGSEHLFFVRLSGFWIWSQQSPICRLRLVAHCFLDLIDGTSSCGAWASGFCFKNDYYNN